MFPRVIVAMERVVKQSKKGLFFHYGGERVYFEAKNIRPGDKIIVFLLGWWDAD